MRSLKVTTILFAAALLVLTPKPAFAWWDLLDYLSGPGPFQGGGVQVRLLCAGKVAWGALSGQVSKAAEHTATVGQGGAAKSDWKQVLGTLHFLNKDIGILDEKEVEELAEMRKKLDDVITPENFEEVARLVANSPAGPAGAKQMRVVLPPAHRMRLDLFDPARRLLDHFYSGYLRIASSGTDLTLCTAKRERTLALEFSAVTERAKGEPNYADGSPIRLTTATADVTYRFSLPAVGDLADIGAGGGVYFFSSSGFSTFSGLILEQFVQLHAPSKWANASTLKKILGRLSLRVGVVEFPAGFDTNQFGAVGANIRHIPGYEVVPQATVLFHFNLTPLFKQNQSHNIDWHDLQ